MEVMVSVAVGAFVTVAAATITADMNKFRHRNLAEIQVGQRLRLGLELLSEDLRHAGVGVGYLADSTFSGFQLGSFSAQGGAQFSSSNRRIETEDGSMVTDDLVVRRAMGERRSLLYLEAGRGEACQGPDLLAGSVVNAASRSGRSMRSLTLLEVVPGACAHGACVDGCIDFSYSENGLFSAGNSSGGVRYRGGDIYSEFDTLVWFVATDEEGRGQLRRAGHEALASCAAPSSSCGGLVATNILSLQVRYARFDQESKQWFTLAPTQPIRTFDRLRIDLELMARGEGNPRMGHAQQVKSELELDVCLPSPCDTPVGDTVPRRALRTTVEIRNAGRHRYR